MSVLDLCQHANVNIKIEFIYFFQDVFLLLYTLPIFGICGYRSLKKAHICAKRVNTSSVDLHTVYYTDYDGLVPTMFGLVDMYTQC